MFQRIGSFLVVISVLVLLFSMSVSSEVPIVDEQGRPTGLININPNPDAEPWIAGGVNKADWEKLMARIPEFKFRGLGGRAPAPDKVNNSESEAFRSIFNQQGSSCAQASSIGYVFTYEINTLRGLTADTEENQYPYSYAYNFVNGGSGNSGSMPNQGFDLAVKTGIPNADVYGGFGLGEHDRWVSGYDVYLNGMANRASEQFTIKVDTEAGINTMREWLHNHGDGSEDGGCLVFCYNSSGCNTVSLASGTPEEGMKAITSFGDGGGHAVTIAGYNDSVRYDYNGDGQYTNNLDINGDRAVTVEDWEIGAVIMVNSWGTSFGNSGKIYVMYRLCAESDGMWSQKVYGMKTGEETVTPHLTYKATVEHGDRNLIRITAGIANDVNATTPEETISFSRAFNYCGGSYEMGGESGPSSIEIGLDVSPLVTMMSSSQAKLFLQIDSKGGTGKVAKFSIIDYLGTSPVETVCDQTDITITPGASDNAETTYLTISFTGSPMINMVAPNGGETWEQGSPYTIAWGDNIDDNVKIELYKGSTLKEEIESSVESNGAYNWVIPQDMEPGNDYAIKIVSTQDPSLTDESSGTFTIEEEFIIAAFPHVEPLEGLVSGAEALPEKWVQLSGDDLEWTAWTGKTPSKEPDQGEATGADGDHTSGTGMYLYVESSSSNNPDKKADFMSPKFDLRSLNNPELSFWCHMFSDNEGKDEMGDLYLDINVDGTWHNEVVHKSGDYGDEWFEVKQSLTDYKGNRVIFRFRAVTGSGWASDICLDDFQVTGEVTPIVSTIKAPLQFDVGCIGSRIHYRIPDGIDKTNISLALYNMQGKLVFELVRDNVSSGNYFLDISKNLAAGLYQCRMKAQKLRKNINVIVTK